MRKKVVLFLITLLLISYSFGQNVGFEFGINFFKPSHSGFTIQNGTTFSIEWGIDKDVSFGISNENTILSHTDIVGITRTGQLSITGILIKKKVIEGIVVGLNLGSGSATITNTITRPVVDIVGSAILLSRKTDKLTGTLSATVASRFMNTQGLQAGPTNISDLNGVNFSVSVSIEF
ncbi:MAG: hypothetical protein NZ928_06955 [Endomicrobia bacterium]|nr:hypothetical protein [Endomicrobiia bacterium]MDW8055759.1 hypothetical protein [Elusimicrobiota bacterium]